MKHSNTVKEDLLGEYAMNNAVNICHNIQVKNIKEWDWVWSEQFIGFSLLPRLSLGPGKWTKGEKEEEEKEKEDKVS